MTSLKSALAVGIAAVLVGVGLSSLSAPAQAQAQPRRIVSGWLPYWGTADAVASMQANADLMSDVGGFWHSALSSTVISDRVPDAQRAAIVAQAHAAHLRVYATVADGTPKGKMASILRSSTLRANQVHALVALAERGDYDGIDLDYESFAFHDGRSTWATTRPAWVQFVRQLSLALHRAGRTLAVTTPPIYDSARSDTSGFWVYDWHDIAPYVDRLRIMAYDYSVSSPGPIAPISWVRQIVAYAVTQVPAGRIQLGVPAYGRNWVVSSTAGCPTDNMPFTTAPTTRQAEALATQYGATKHWDASTAERSFTYRKVYAGHAADGSAAACTVTRKVVYDDAHAVLDRTELVARYHLAGVALWALGYEGAGQFTQLRTYARSVAKRTPVVSLYAGDTTYGRRIIVSGKVRSPGGTPVADLPWTLQWSRPGQSWQKVATGRTSATGTLSVSRLPRANGSYRLLVSGSWWYYPGSSAPNSSTVRLAVTAALSAGSVRHGHPVSLRGRVAPTEAGLLVDRQVRQGGAWVTVASTHTSSEGRFAFRVTPPRATWYAYRVVVHSDGYRANGYSARLLLHAT